MRAETDPDDLLAPPAVIRGVLDIMRRHLDMDVAFLGRIRGAHRIITAVSAPPDEDLVVPGRADALEGTYCRRILSGELGVLTDDALDDAVLRDMAITADLRIRAYAGVPVRLRDGTVYGTLCSFSRSPGHLRIEDALALQLAAGLIAHRLEPLLRPLPDLPAPVDGDLQMVYQPVRNLRTGEVRGYEALARFDGEAVVAPDDWFAMARRLGLDSMLQQQALARAIEVLPDIPGEQYLAVNCSDAVIVDPDVLDLLDVPEADRIVVELTEHEVGGATDVTAALAVLRARGTRIALDDVGAGYAGLARVLDIAPELIKLDRSLITGVHQDAARQAMVQAFTIYARAVGTLVVAEGIETPEDADALRILGVDKGQGFVLGRPGRRPWADAGA